MPTDGYWDRYAVACDVLEKGGGEAFLSSNTSVQRMTIHWRTGQAMAELQPRVFGIRDTNMGRQLYKRRRHQPVPDRVIEATGPGPGKWIQILTDAGEISVHTGLITSQGGLPAVTVEIVPADPDRPRTSGNGRWVPEVRDYIPGRIEISLVRKGDS
jgi:hypothetical protein